MFNYSHPDEIFINNNFKMFTEIDKIIIYNTLDSTIHTLTEALYLSETGLISSTSYIPCKRARTGTWKVQWSHACKGSESSRVQVQANIFILK